MGKAPARGPDTVKAWAAFRKAVRSPLRSSGADSRAQLARRNGLLDLPVRRGRKLKQFTQLGQGNRRGTPFLEQQPSTAVLISSRKFSFQGGKLASVAVPRGYRPCAVPRNLQT